MTIVDYAVRISRQWILICAVALAFALGALFMVNVSYVKPVPMYGSTAQVIIVESQVSANGVITTKNSAQTIIDLMSTAQIMNPVSAQLGINSQDMPTQVSISGYVAPSSSVLRVTAQSQQADLAVRAADATVAVVSEYARTVMHADTKIVQAATPATLVDPKKDTRTSNVLLAAVVGVVVGLFVAFLRIWFNPKIHSVREIYGVEPSREFTLDFPVTAGTQKPRSDQHDSVNQIRTTILVGAESTSCLVSIWPLSSGAAVKEFVSSLAESFASAHHRTVVISFDANEAKKSPSVGGHSMATTEVMKRLTTAQVGASHLVIPVSDEHVGTYALSPEFSKLLTKLSATFSVILVQGPDSVSSDAGLALSSTANDVVLLAQAGETKLSLLQQHIDLLTAEALKKPIIALVSPKVESKSIDTRRK